MLQVDIVPNDLIDWILAENKNVVCEHFIGTVCSISTYL